MVYTAAEVERAHKAAHADVGSLTAALALIGSNVVRFITQMGTHNHMRQPLLHIISPDVPITMMTALCHASRRAVETSAHASLLDFQRAHGDAAHERVCIPAVETTAITRYIHGRCQTVSGSNDARGDQFGSINHLYEQYTNDITFIVYDVVTLLLGMRYGINEYVLPSAAAKDLVSQWYGLSYNIRADTSWRIHINNQSLINNIDTLIRYRNRLWCTIRALLRQRLSPGNASNVYQTIVYMCDDMLQLPEAIRSIGIHARARGTFYGIRRRLHDIHHHSSTKPEFNCLICYYHEHPTAPEDVTMGEKHKKIVEIQRKTYQAIKNQCDIGCSPNSAVMVIDWTTITTQPNTAAHASEKKEGQIKALIMAVLRRGIWYYHVFMATSEDARHKKYWLNVLGFRTILEQTKNASSPLYGINNISLWSDGGSGDFKNRYWLSYLLLAPSWWSSANTYNTMSVNYFGSYHGHSECDAEAGRLKTMVRAMVEQQCTDRINNIPGCSIDVI
jgi:hypothetical protein